MKLLAALNLILPFYLFASSVATLNVGGETYDSEKKTNLQLLMNSHNKLPPAVEFGLERHQIRKNKQNVRHAEEEEVFTTCMNDLFESYDVQLEYAVAIPFEALSAPVTCIEDGTSCTSDWSNTDLSAGEDVCKQHDMELYLVDAQLDGCLATNDDFAFNNTGDDYKYSSDDSLDSAESVLFIDYPLGCIPASCEKEEIEDLFLSSNESCETTLIESFLYGEDVSEDEEVLTPSCMNDMESNTIELEYSFVINYLEAKAASVTCIEDGTVCTSDWSNIDLSAGEDVCKQHDRELYLLDAQFHGCPATNTGDDYKYSSDDPLDSAHSVLFIDYPLGCIPTSCDKEEIEDLFLSSFESCELILIESLYLYGEDASSTSGSMNPFNKKNQGIGMSLMIAGIIGTYA